MILNTTQEEVEVEQQTKPKSKGRPKGSKNRVYILNPEFNREIHQQTKYKSNSNLNSNTVFYMVYTAGPEILIYDDPKIIKEVIK